jgi:hypothetical protein
LGLGLGFHSVIGHGVIPITLSRMVRKSDPCKGLVMRSAIIFSVGHYTSLMIPLTRRSCSQKHPIRMCRESSEVGLPFDSGLVVLEYRDRASGVPLFLYEVPLGLFRII